jgi:4-amino-4-deoxy-L-arabinose transferase-like glycosyltransferase
VIPLLTCCAIHAVLLIGILINNPAYLWDHGMHLNPDAGQYVVEGENVWLRGQFSRCAIAPFVPDSLRTPIYPVFAGALIIVGDPATLYCVQAALNVLSCALVYLLARRLLNPWAAFAAAMLFATDLMVAISAFEAMSEVLFMFLTLVGIVILVPRRLDDDLPSLQACAAGGLLLAIATLTRPAGLYLTAVVAMVLVVYALAKSRVRKGVLGGIALLLCFAIPVSMWIARNGVVFDLWRLSTADAIMMVYFAGAGAYQVEHDVDLETAQEMIADEYKLPTPTITNNHWNSDISVREMDDKLRTAQVEVLRKYPLALVQSSVLGVLKSHLSHNVGDLGSMLGIPWNSTSSLRTQQKSRIHALLSNNPILVFALGWQLAHTAIVWSLFALGTCALTRGFQFRWPHFLLASVIAYFVLTVAIVGSEAYCRSRTPHMPFVCVVAGASVQLFKRSPKEALGR